MVPALQVIVACRLLDPETQVTRHALIPIPETLGRRVPVTTEGDSHAFLLIEDLVAAHAARFFPGENVTATTAFRVTRNGDIAVQEEDAIDLAGEMEDVLTARRFADTVRLELRADAPARPRPHDPGSHRRGSPRNLSGRRPARTRLLHGTGVAAGLRSPARCGLAGPELAGHRARRVDV